MTSRLWFPIASGIVAVLITVSACGGGGMSEGTARTHYAGQVLDFDSGAPMNRVIVTVIWYSEIASLAGQAPRDEFHAAVEVWTDVNGRFEVPAVPTRQLPHSDLLQKPVALFFLPGYLDWHHRFERDPRLPNPRLTVLLKRAQDPVEAVKAVTIPRLVPYAAIPLLAGALNQERARLGLAPLALPE